MSFHYYMEEKWKGQSIDQSDINKETFKVLTLILFLVIG